MPSTCRVVTASLLLIPYLLTACGERTSGTAPPARPLPVSPSGVEEIFADRGADEFIRISGESELPAEVREALEADASARSVAIRVWDLATGSIEMYGAADYADAELSFLPPKQWLVAATHRGVACFDLQSGRQVRLVSLRSFDVLIDAAVGVSQAGDIVAFATRDGKVRVLDSASGSELWSAAQPQRISEGALRFVFSPGEQYLALQGRPDKRRFSAASADVVYLWHLPSGEHVATITGRFLAFSPDGRSIVVVESATTATTRVAMYRIGENTPTVLRPDSIDGGPRFGRFLDPSRVLLDLSGTQRSVHLRLETLAVPAGESLARLILPALNYAEDWDVSHEGSMFARLVRNGTDEMRILVHDLSSGGLRRTIDFSGRRPPAMIGSFCLLGPNRLATAHPEVIWSD